MRKSIKLILSTVFMALLGSFPAFAGQWIQDPGRAAVADGVSNWRWMEDDGTYASDCELWLDGDQNGVYENYHFNGDGWMLADTETMYGEKMNGDGAVLYADGTVKTITAPKDSAVIASRDYLLTLPDNWKNHFCYSMHDGNLYVEFYPMKPLTIDGKVRSTVSQTMIWILRFDSREEMEQTRAEGLYDGWMYLGSHNGAYYVSCGPTDTAIEFFTETERDWMQQMNSSLLAGSQVSLWGRMAFYQ